MTAREAFRSRLRRVGGRADCWAAFAGADTFALVVDVLVVLPGARLRAEQLGS